MRRLLVLLLAVPLGAEFRQVEIKVSGLDCASCAESLPKTFEKMRGVESAAVDTKTGLVTIKLKPGNRVPLEDLRDKLKQAGYTPGDAKVRALGTLVSEAGNGQGKWQFHLSGMARSYAAQAPASLKSSNDRWKWKA